MYTAYSYYDGSDPDNVEFFASVTHTTRRDLESVGHKFGYEFSADLVCYNDLGEAIEKSGCWPTEIRYGRDFTDGEKAVIVRTTVRLINDEAFRAGFKDLNGTREFTLADIKYDEGSKEAA